MSGEQFSAPAVVSRGATAPADGRGRRRSGWRRPSFGLRSMLLLTLGLALWLGPRVNTAREHRRTARVVELLGGYVSLRGDGPPALRDILGDWFFDRVVGIGLGRGAGDGDLQTLSRLTAFRRVDELSLAGSGFGDDALEIAAELPGLERLTLTGTRVTDVGLTRLWERRPTLSIAGHTQFEFFHPQASFVSLAGHRLNLTGPHLTDASLARVGGCVGLRWLSLDATQVTAAGLEELRRLRSLRFLGLNGTAIGDEAAPLLAELPNLEELELARTSIGSAGVIELARLERLERLVLDGTEVGAAGITALSQCPRLRELSLRATRLDDRDVGALARLRGVEVLDLRETKLTYMGLEQLRCALTTTTILR